MRTWMTPTALALGMALLAGCGEEIGNSRRAGAEGPLFTPELDVPTPLCVDVDSVPVAPSSRLMRHLLGTPHGYFRFINRQFTAQVCKHFAADDFRLPTVNLHGDAHLEQYAVSPSGWGLADFDAAGYGPPTIDLVRFCASLRLAWRQLELPGDEEQVCRDFLDSYLAAVQDPDPTPPRPPLVDAIRAGWSGDRSSLVERTAALMEPLDVPRAEIEERMRAYRDAVLAGPDAPEAGFFAVKDVGPLNVGIGSALNTKHLARLEGPGPRDDDDIFLEARQVHTRDRGACISGTRRDDPVLALTIASRVGRHHDPLAGYVVFGPDTVEGKAPGAFWIRTWELNYGEAEIGGNVKTSADVMALAADVGIQLGTGHPRQLADPHEHQLRRELHATVTDLADEVIAYSAEMADLTLRAWSRFCTGAEAKTEPSP